jgi:phosphatidylinositol-3-phosphatase
MRTPGSPPLRMIVVAAASLTMVSACTTAATPAASIPPLPANIPDRAGATQTARGSSEPDPLVVIFMENHERTQVVGSPEAPFQNAMLRHGRDYANYYAITHPSLPNYLAVASGTTNGKRSDDIAAGELSPGPTLWDQLSAAHLDWAVYEESMPSPCYSPYSAGAEPGDYALKHNPATPFRSVYDDPQRCSQVRPLSAMDPTRLPEFAFITPNECNDAHSCPLAAADRWLGQLVPRLVGAGADVVVTYDEGTTDLGVGGSSGGGHVYAVEVGPGVPAGSVLSQPLNHYSLLAGIEDRFGLRPLDGVADATPMPT